MTAFNFICRSSRFHWRSLAVIALGATLAVTVLTGAIVTGHSVRVSVTQQLLGHLGNTTHALSTGDQLFAADLPERLAKQLPLVADSATTATAATTSAHPPRFCSALQRGGTATRPGATESRCAVTAIGVDPAFATLFPAGEWPVASPLRPGQAVLGATTARRLQAAVGTELTLRLAPVAPLPLDSTFTSQSAASRPKLLRVTVAGIAPDAGVGGFQLGVNQETAANLFVDRTWLATELQVPGAANILLAALPPTVSEQALSSALTAAWKPVDSGLILTRLPEIAGSATTTWELRSKHVFIADSAGNALVPGQCRVLTYFVNAISAKGKSTPYSFVTGAEAPVVPVELPDDAVILSPWLAEDLGVAAGDTITLEYFQITPEQRLATASASLKVHAVTAPAAGVDTSLMPDFPGFKESESCNQWDPSVPIDLTRIRPKDEDYWKAHRGTPKALVSLRTAQKLWANRFGSLTAVRWSEAAAESSAVTPTAAAPWFAAAQAAMPFAPVRAQALAGSRQGVDFAGLFTGLSFFLIATALIFTAWLFMLHVEARSTESGTLLALGIPPRRAKWLIAGDAVLPALAGSLLGVPLGLLYTRGLLWALSSQWQEAVGTEALKLHLSATNLATAGAAGCLTALLAMAAGLWRRRLQTIHTLQAGAAPMRPGQERANRQLWLGIGMGSLLAAVGLVGWGMPQHGVDAAAAFGGAGALAMTGLLAVLRRSLARPAESAGDLNKCECPPKGRTTNGNATAPTLTLARLAVLTVGRRPWGALALTAMFAAAVFLLAAIAANRPEADAHDRHSGTGGFALYGESALPLAKNLESAEGRQHYGLNSVPGDVTFMTLLRHDGDEASCRNMNRAQNPRLLGVPAAVLDQRDAFGFAALAAGVDPAHPWRALLPAPGATAAGTVEVVPVVADMNVILWGLGKRLGDELELKNEAGAPVRLKLVGGMKPSILQGGLILDKAALQRHFPHTSGARIILVDAPAAAAAALQQQPPIPLQDAGVEFLPSGERLAMFTQVETTYLAIFTTLGGLALLLGCAGLGIMLLRHTQERGWELAVQQALGFSPRRIRIGLLLEYGGLLGVGAGIGAVAAALAMVPAWKAGMGGVTLAVAWVILGMLVLGLSSLWAAVALTTRRPVLRLLQGE